MNSFYACDDVSAIPSCPPGRYISSGSLQFGRWDNTICLGPGVNRSSPTIFDVLAFPSKCLQGASSCILGNSDSMVKYFGDPLPGIAKHVSYWMVYKHSLFILIFLQWRLNWTCSDTIPSTENNRFYACDSVNVTLKCPNGQFITSGSFLYGRWNNNICPGPGINSTTPKSFGLYNLPASCLHGVNSCDFGYQKSLQNLFGDPSPGVKKHVSKENVYMEFVNNHYFRSGM